MEENKHSKTISKHFDSICRIQHVNPKVLFGRYGAKIDTKVDTKVHSMADNTINRDTCESIVHGVLKTTIKNTKAQMNKKKRTSEEDNESNDNQASSGSEKKKVRGVYDCVYIDVTEIMTCAFLPWMIQTLITASLREKVLADLSSIIDMVNQDEDGQRSLFSDIQWATSTNYMKKEANADSGLIFLLRALGCNSVAILWVVYRLNGIHHYIGNPQLSDEEKTFLRIFEFVLERLKYDWEYLTVDSTLNLTEQDFHSAL
ncbi:hypothetical protein BDA99DRAFT_555927 [Phascolomyces articulosus]|uniref:Uncharacterized protein n=1 Tax=Phascolomyces articulosus TaxID=60185 RepID=A0AAD5K8V6_9FUNG|nr:hypothetical protein BDA99DRAFT_555927 [Phascolomyces articulosus]